MSWMKDIFLNKYAELTLTEQTAARHRPGIHLSKGQESKVRYTEHGAEVSPEASGFKARNQQLAPGSELTEYDKDNQKVAFEVEGDDGSSWTNHPTRYTTDYAETSWDPWGEEEPSKEEMRKHYLAAMLAMSKSKDRKYMLEGNWADTGYQQRDLTPENAEFMAGALSGDVGEGENFMLGYINQKKASLSKKAKALMIISKSTGMIPPMDPCCCQPQELIPGGAAEGMPADDFPPDSIEEGRTYEMRHTNDPQIAEELAKDNLKKDNMYYEKLPKEATKQDPLTKHDTTESFFKNKKGVSKGEAPGEVNLSQDKYEELGDLTPVLLYNTDGQPADHHQTWRDVGEISVTHKTASRSRNMTNKNASEKSQAISAVRRLIQKEAFLGRKPKSAPSEDWKESIRSKHTALINSPAYKARSPEVNDRMRQQTSAYLNSPAGRTQYPGEQKGSALKSQSELLAGKAGVDPNDPWMTSKGPGKQYSSSNTAPLNPHHARTLAKLKSQQKISPAIADMRSQGVTNPRLMPMIESMRGLGLTDEAIQSTAKAFDAFAKKKGLQGDAYNSMMQRAIAQMSRKGNKRVAGLRKQSPQVAGR